MNFFLTLLLLAFATLSDAETASPPPATDKPTLPAPTATPAPTSVPTPATSNKPPAPSSATTSDKPPVPANTKPSEPPVVTNDKPPASTKLKTPQPLDNPLTSAKPECNIKAVMSDDEMRLCGIKIHTQNCQPSNATLAVAKVQAALQLQNYYVGDLTGVVDEHTKTAIMVYKELNHLPINDVIDNKLLDLLKVDSLVLNKSFHPCANSHIPKKRLRKSSKKHRRRK